MNLLKDASVIVVKKKLAWLCHVAAPLALWPRPKT